MKILTEVRHIKECKYCGEEDLSWYDLGDGEGFQLFKCNVIEGHAYNEGGEITHVELDTALPHKCKGQRRSGWKPKKRSETPKTI